MMRALFAAISGLRNHQLFIDVVGNNLANVNTTGFRAGRMTFSELFSQTLKSGSGPQTAPGTGGVNSQQVGLGSAPGAIDVLQVQGSFQTTGKPTDMAIQGDGFFIVSPDGVSTNLRYTRDGAFDIDANGTLVNPGSGFRVMGWNADATGKVDNTVPIQALTIPIGQSTVAAATTKANFVGNLDARAAPFAAGPPETGGKATAGMTVIDSRGQTHLITITFTKFDADTWAWKLSTTETALTGIDPASIAETGNIDFDTSGKVTAGGTPAAITATAAGAAALSISVDFTKITHLAALSEVAMTTQDGFATGSLVSFRLSAAGEIIGAYSNGLTRNLGQLALANFVNSGGLVRAGQNLFEESRSSGAAFIGIPGAGGRGVAVSGNLESSNVDLSKEFTNMIIGQRGFQSNARVVSTGDEMLQDLVNLRR